MKKGIVCIVLVFSVLFGLAACVGGTPTIDVLYIDVEVTDEDGSTYFISVPMTDDSGETMTRGTTKKGATVPTTVSLPAEIAGIFPPQNTDPNDPFLQVINDTVEVLAEQTMPAGAEVRAEADSNPAKTLLKTTKSGQAFTGDKFTIDMTITSKNVNGETVSMPAKIVKNGDKFYLSMTANSRSLGGLPMEGIDAEGAAALTALFGGNFQMALMYDGKKNYMILPKLLMYMEVPPDMMGGEASKGAGALVGDGGGELIYQNTTKVTLNKKEYTCETYQSGSEIKKFYFLKNELKRLEIITDVADPILYDFSSIKNTASASVFTISRAYTDMASLANLMPS